MIDHTLDDGMKDDTVAGTAHPQPKIPLPSSGTGLTNDLARLIERAVDREPDDWVRCVRVFGDYYRCNWWSRKGRQRDGLDFDFGGLLTDHVRKSRFLRATMQASQLVLVEVSDSGPAPAAAVEIPQSPESSCVGGSDVLD